MKTTRKALAVIWVAALSTIGCQTSPERAPQGAKVVAAAGDIACDASDSDFGGDDPDLCQNRATADLLVDADAVIPLGDLQYPDGALDSYEEGYDPTWGKFANESYPAPGNHDYHVAGAKGYFGYWTSKDRPTGSGRSGYYSWDLGAWHLIALNSNCDFVPCDQGSPQNDFLEQDLANTNQPCVLAYWHHPLFNSGDTHGSSEPSGAKAFWQDLTAAGADIVVNGHEHNYQRYGKQDASGRAMSNGIREFVAGTGGKSHYGLLEEKDPNYETGNATDFGVLMLHLRGDAYSWEFVSVGGAMLDEGGPVPCN